MTLQNYDKRKRVQYTLLSELAYSRLFWAQYEGDVEYFRDYFSSLPQDTIRDQILHVVQPFLPGGWYDYNRANSLRIWMSGLQALQEANVLHYLANEGNRRTSQRIGLDVLGNAYLKIDTVRNFNKNWCFMLGGHMAVHLAQVATAGERYALVHQQYPDKAKDLVPDFLEQLPLDLDGQPLGYAKDTSNGRGKVWSLGWNGIDEGGVRTSDQVNDPLAWRSAVGDWVWDYPVDAKGEAGDNLETATPAETN